MRSTLSAQHRAIFFFTTLNVDISHSPWLSYFCTELFSTQQLDGSAFTHQPGFVTFTSDSIGSILLIRLSSLGDVLLSTPLIRALRARFIGARIDVAVASQFADVWTYNPHVSNVVLIDKSKSAFSPMLERPHGMVDNSYDLAIDLQRSMRSYVLRRRFARRSLLVEKFRSQKLDLVRKKSLNNPLPHIVQRYHQAVAELNVAHDSLGLELWLESDRKAGHYLATGVSAEHQHSRRIVIAPGAHHATKRWPVKHFAELSESLVRNFDAEVVLVGGEADYKDCQAIATQCSVSIQVAVGNSIHDTATIMDTAAVVVSNDSAAMHIAAARRRPVVALYGSTVPAFGFTPYGTRSTIVERELSCRPCTHIGRERCPLGHFDCMNLISVRQVQDAVVNIQSLS